MKKHIVILGAGFGGIATYKNIPQWVKNHCKITVIDKQNHFLFTPLLPEVAGATLNHYDVALPIRDIIREPAQVIQSEIISVDTQKKVVELTHTRLGYDILVSTLGSKTHFFGTPGAEEYSYILKDLKSAVDLRARCIDCFEAASKETDPIQRKKHLEFMVIGAGPTGAELIGEMADLFFTTFSKQFPMLDMNEVSLVLINSGETILRMFDQSLGNYAESALKKDRVTIRNNVRIAEVTDTGVVTAGGETISVNTVIWAAGVTANNLPSSCGSFEVNRGRICVDEYMQAKNTQDIFVIGDMSHYPTPDERGLPMTAQIAKQQGIVTGKNIGRLLQDKKLENFVYNEKGLLASLGRFNAIAQVGPIKLKGFFAWILWRAIYLRTFDSWKKRFSIMTDWFIGLFTRKETTRL